MSRWCDVNGEWHEIPPEPGPKGLDKLLAAGSRLNPAHPELGINRFDTDQPSWEDGQSRSERCEVCRQRIGWTKFIIKWERPDRTWVMEHDWDDLAAWQACNRTTCLRYKPGSIDVRVNRERAKWRAAAWYLYMNHGAYLDGSGRQPGRDRTSGTGLR